MKKSSAGPRFIGESGASDFTGSDFVWLTVLLAAGVVESNALAALAIVSVFLRGALLLLVTGWLRLNPARAFR